MDLSPSWSPSIDLDEFPDLIAIEENALVPGPSNDPAWTRSAIKRILVNVPEGFEAIWASVLAVWRLKTLEEKLEGDSPIQILWSQYLAEWLVSPSRDRGKDGKG